MPILRPDIYDHNNPIYPIVDTNSIKGGHHILPYTIHRVDLGDITYSNRKEIPIRHLIEGQTATEWDVLADPQSVIWRLIDIDLHDQDEGWEVLSTSGGSSLWKREENNLLHPLTEEDYVLIGYVEDPQLVIPQAILSISGDISFLNENSQIFPVQPTSGAGYDFTVRAGNADTNTTTGGDLYLRGGAGGAASGSPDGGSVYIYGGGGDTPGNIMLAYNGSGAVGRVGIGRAPAATLDVNGSFGLENSASTTVNEIIGSVPGLSAASTDDELATAKAIWDAITSGGGTNSYLSAVDASDITAVLFTVTNGTNITEDFSHTHPALEGYWDRNEVDEYLYPKEIKDKVIIGSDVEPSEMLEITGNLAFSAGGDRIISVNRTDTPTPTHRLTIEGARSHIDIAVGGEVHITGGHGSFSGGTSYGGNVYVYGQNGDSVGSVSLGWDGDLVYTPVFVNLSGTSSDSIVVETGGVLGKRQLDDIISATAVWQNVADVVSLIDATANTVIFRTDEVLQFGSGGQLHTFTYDNVNGHMLVTGDQWNYTTLAVESFMLQDNGLVSYNTFTSSGIFEDVDWTSDTQLVSAKAIESLIDTTITEESHWDRNTGDGYLYPKDLLDRVGVGTDIPQHMFEVNGNIGFTEGADRVISVNKRGEVGVAYALTVQAGDSHFDTPIGGNLYLTGGSGGIGQGTSTGGNVYVYGQNGDGVGTAVIGWDGDALYTPVFVHLEDSDSDSIVVESGGMLGKRTLEDIIGEGSFWERVGTTLIPKTSTDKVRIDELLLFNNAGLAYIPTTSLGIFEAVDWTKDDQVVSAKAIWAEIDNVATVDKYLSAVDASDISAVSFTITNGTDITEDFSHTHPEYEPVWDNTADVVSLVDATANTVIFRPDEVLEFGSGAMYHAITFDTVENHVHVEGRQWEYDADLQVNASLQFPNNTITGHNVFYSSGVFEDVDWTNDEQFVSAKAIESLIDITITDESHWDRNTIDGYIYQKELTDKVGIGTDIPQHMFEVNGDMGFTEGANRSISVNQRSDVGTAYSLTLQAGDAHTDTDTGGHTYITGGSGGFGGGFSWGGSVYIYGRGGDGVGTVSLGWDGGAIFTPVFANLNASSSDSIVVESSGILGKRDLSDIIPDAVWQNINDVVTLIDATANTVALRTDEPLEFGVGGMYHAIEYDPALQHMDVKGRSWDFSAILEVTTFVMQPNTLGNLANTFYDSGIVGDVDWADDAQLVSAAAIKAEIDNVSSTDSYLSGVDASDISAVLFTIENGTNITEDFSHTHPGYESFWDRNAVNGYLYPTTITDKVGIGIDAPEHMLEINGNLGFTEGANREITVNQRSDVGTAYSLSISAGASHTNTILGGHTYITGGAGGIGLGTSAGGSVYIYGHNGDGVGSVLLGWDGELLYTPVFVNLEDTDSDSVVVEVGGMLGKRSIGDLISANGYWERNDSLGYLYQSNLTDKVGIGIAVPEHALEVNGNFGFTEGDDRVISVNQRSDVGVAYSLTIQAGDSHFDTAKGGHTYITGGAGGFGGGAAWGGSVYIYGHGGDGVGTVSLGWDGDLLYTPVFVNLGTTSSDSIVVESGGILSKRDLSTITLSPLTTKGDIYTYSTVDARLPVGTDTYVLTSDSSETTGLKWTDARRYWDRSTYDAGVTYFIHPTTDTDKLSIGKSGGGIYGDEEALNVWGRISVQDSNTYNIIIGHGSGVPEVDMGGNDNMIIGRSSGTQITGTGCSRNLVMGSTAFGYTSTAETTGAENVAIGNNSLLNIIGGNRNLAIGYQSMYELTNASYNIGIGASSLAFVEGNYNTGVGASSLLFCSGDYNIAIGYNASIGQAAHAIGDNNIAIGHLAHNYGGGNENITIGRSAGAKIAASDNNILIGIRAGFDIYNAGHNNIFIGESSGENTTVSDNISIGQYSMYKNITGTKSVGIGIQSLYGATAASSNYNTAIGHASGRNTYGDYNTFLGYQAGHDNTTGTYNIAIGADIETGVTESYKLNIGGILKGEIDNGIVSIHNTLHFVPIPTIDVVTTPLEGMVYADFTDKDLYYYNNAEWVSLTEGGGGGGELINHHETHEIGGVDEVNIDGGYF